MDVARAAPGAGRLLLAIGFASVLSTVGTAAAPFLVDHPLVLCALSPRLPFLLFASASAPMWLFLVVALPRLLTTDPLYYALGRRYGPAALDLLPRRLQRVAASATLASPLLVFVRPIGRHVLLAACDRRWGFRHIAVADVAGTLVYLLALHELAQLA